MGFLKDVFDVGKAYVAYRRAVGRLSSDDRFYLNQLGKTDRDANKKGKELGKKFREGGMVPAPKKPDKVPVHIHQVSPGQLDPTFSGEIEMSEKDLEAIRFFNYRGETFDLPTKKNWDMAWPEGDKTVSIASAWIPSNELEEACGNPFTGEIIIDDPLNNINTEENL